MCTLVKCISRTASMWHWYGKWPATYITSLHTDFAVCSMLYANTSKICSMPKKFPDVFWFGGNPQYTCDQSISPTDATPCRVTVKTWADIYWSSLMGKKMWRMSLSLPFCAKYRLGYLPVYRGVKMSNWVFLQYAVFEYVQVAVCAVCNTYKMQYVQGVL